MVCLNQEAFETLLVSGNAHAGHPLLPVLSVPHPLTLTHRTVTLGGFLTLAHYNQALKARKRYPKLTKVLLAISQTFVWISLFQAYIAIVVPPRDFGVGLILLGVFAASGLTVRQLKRRLFWAHKYPFDEGNGVGWGAGVNDEGVQIWTAQSQTNYRWSAFSGYWISRDILVLKRGNSWLPLPREHCHSERHWQLLQQVVSTYLNKLTPANIFGSLLP